MRRPAVVATLAVLAALAAAAACSSPPRPAATPRSTGGSAAPGPRTNYPLTLTQPDGSTVVVKARPTRVVTVDNPAFAVDELVALGVKPIGGLVYPAAVNNQPNSPYDSRGIPKEVSNQITSFTPVGTAPSSPDLEAIAALHPDLIVGTNGAATADLKQLEAIAPVADFGLNTTATTNQGIDTVIWTPQLRLLSRVLDRQAQAKTVITNFEAAAAPVRQALTGKTAALVLPLADGANVNVIGPHQQPNGHLLTYLGVTVSGFPADSHLTPDGGGNVAMLSLERVGELTGNYLVVLGSSPAAQTFLANPLVQHLSAVKAGHVVIVGNGFGTGILNAGPIGEQACLPGIRRAFR